MAYRVKEMAQLAGVSVRTLHHYDAIGLLKPHSLTEAGYREYTHEDLQRLQQILFFRELGFNLREIKEIMDNPSFDRLEALRSQRQLLFKQKTRLERIIELIEKTIISEQGEKSMEKKEMFKAFDTTDIDTHRKLYADEVKKRYGHTDAYRESRKRTSHYDKQQWADIMAQCNDIFNTMAQLMDRDPGDQAVQEVVETWRNYIDKNFYTCTPEIFQSLGEMYTSDERFTANIDGIRPGLAQYLSTAISIYCAKAE
jgi:DNA-binding transcriptional MerR regulator